MVVLDIFFHLGGKKKWSLTVFDWWLSYIVTIVWEFAWADSALVVLDECLFHRGGRLNRFDCIMFITNHRTSLHLW